MPVVKADVHAPIFCFPKILNYKIMKQEVYTDYENIKEFAPISDVKDEFMHDWTFHFNPYTGLWNAIPRNLYSAYWSNYDIKGILRSKDINTLLYLLHRGKGDINAVYKLTDSENK
jgi:hypothetical protein